MKLGMRLTTAVIERDSHICDCDAMIQRVVHPPAVRCDQCYDKTNDSDLRAVHTLSSDAQPPQFTGPQQQA
jgi:hypothetical protein